MQYINSLDLGNALSYNLTAGTNGGVTVAIDSDQEVTVSGTLSTNTVLTFGNANLNFQVISYPLNQIVNLAFN